MPVAEIRRVLCGELSLPEAMTANIAQLEAQIESLNGALRLSRQLEKEQPAELDTDRYRDAIHEQEQKGNRFADIMIDYWTLMKPTFFRIFALDPKGSLRKTVIGVLVFCLLFGLWGTFVLKAGSFWDNFFHWPMVFLMVAAVVFPIYLVGRKHSKAASVMANILLTLCLLLVALIAVLLAVLLLNSIFRFLY